MREHFGAHPRAHNDFILNLSNLFFVRVQSPLRTRLDGWMRQKGAEWRPRGHVSNKALSGSGCCRPLCVITTRLQLHMVYIRACTLIYTLFVQYTIFCLCFTRRQRHTAKRLYMEFLIKVERHNRNNTILNLFSLKICPGTEKCGPRRDIRKYTGFTNELWKNFGKLLKNEKTVP